MVALLDTRLITASLPSSPLMGPPPAPAPPLEVGFPPPEDPRTELAREVPLSGGAAAAAAALASFLRVMDVARSQASAEHWHMESCETKGRVRQETSAMICKCSHKTMGHTASRKSGVPRSAANRSPSDT